jgi:F-type H+-transporting ATPase subunit gamma
MEDIEGLAAHRRAIEATIPLLDAMRSIAEMVFRLAQRATTPLDAYAEQVTTMLNTLASTLEPAVQEQIFARMTGSGRRAVVVVGSERGLCGAFNESLLRHAQTLLTTDTLLICWGSRLARAAHSAGYRVDVSLPLPSLRIASYAEAEQMTLALLDLVEDRGVSGVRIVYDAPVRGFQHSVMTEQILPPAALVQLTRHRIPTEVKPSEDTSTLLIQLITEHVLTKVYRVVIQSALSEQLARIAAMRLASDNAHNLLDELTTQYNLARQHAITQSLLEIVTGYETALQVTDASV